MKSAGMRDITRMNIPARVFSCVQQSWNATQEMQFLRPSVRIHSLQLDNIDNSIWPRGCMIFWRGRLLEPLKNKFGDVIIH